MGMKDPSEKVGDWLTVIITTSPVPSAPSTNLLDSVIASFKEHCPCLLACKVIVVLDTSDGVAETARLKRGVVTAEVAANFDEYRQRVKDLVLGSFLPGHDYDFHYKTGEATFGSPDDLSNSVPLKITQTLYHNVTFVEPISRIGFSLAVKSALELAETPYVWVHQHDWTLECGIPLVSMLRVMHSHHDNVNDPVRYICLPSTRLLRYASQSDNMRYPSFRQLTADHQQNFLDSDQPVALTPLFLWQDKPHIANVKHYMDRIFPSRYACKRGTFIEDTIGHKLREQIKQDAGQWQKWATWLYYPEKGEQLCLRHLDGRTRSVMKGLSSYGDRWRTQNRDHPIGADRIGVQPAD